MSKTPRQPSTERPTPSVAEYVPAAVLSWLIPGAGHWLLGYRIRAIVLGVSVLGLFWTGESVLARNMAVSREVSPIFFYVQLGNGLSTLAANKLWGEPTVPASRTTIDLELPRYYNLGILVTLLSGLLNALLVLHVLDPRSWAEARAGGDSPRAPPSSHDATGRKR